MKLHYKTTEEFNSWPLDIRQGCAGLGHENIVKFQEKCKNIIAAHWTTTEKDKERYKDIAESLFSGVIPKGLKRVGISGASSYARWYKFDMNGERIGFGLNTPIPSHVWDKMEWV